MKDPQNWAKELKEMKYDYLEKYHNSFFIASGSRTMKIKSYRDDTANFLTAAILDYVKFIGGNATRINSMGVARKERIELAFGNYREKLTFTPSGTRKGVADIKIIYKGFAVDCEVKVGKDVLSPNQIKEKGRIEKAQGVYIVVKSFEDFLTHWLPVKDRLDKASTILNSIESV